MKKINKKLNTPKVTATGMYVIALYAFISSFSKVLICSACIQGGR